ncbi:MAG: phosphoribosyltransferase, partial [Parvibaculaceae bacterium]
EQYDSMSIATDLLEAPYDQIVVVDDFITRGRTLTAACSRVQEAFPDATVRAFTYGYFRPNRRKGAVVGMVFMRSFPTFSSLF